VLATVGGYKNTMPQYVLRNCPDILFRKHTEPNRFQQPSKGPFPWYLCLKYREIATKIQEIGVNLSYTTHPNIHLPIWNLTDVRPKFDVTIDVKPCKWEVRLHQWHTSHTDDDQPRGNKKLRACPILSGEKHHHYSRNKYYHLRNFNRLPSRRCLIFYRTVLRRRKQHLPSSVSIVCFQSVGQLNG
jgi:hypothetical protein